VGVLLFLLAISCWPQDRNPVKSKYGTEKALRRFETFARLDEKGKESASVGTLYFLFSKSCFKFLSDTLNDFVE
jgi:hypothetical protein